MGNNTNGTMPMFFDQMGNNTMNGTFPVFFHQMINGTNVTFPMFFM